jgi:MFS family permease
MCAVFLIPFLITFPETGRNVVGNGSIPPQGWNMSLLNYLQSRKQSNQDANSLSRTTSREQQRRAQAALAAKRKSKIPNPLHVIHIILEKEVGILLIYSSIIYVAFMDVAASLPSIFAKTYHFNDLQIGLCFLPFGVGSSCAAFVNGRLMDRNYRRLAKKHGFPTSRRRQVDLRHFPLERARLQIVFPMLYTGIACILAYGWVVDRAVHIAVPLVLLFFNGYFITGSFNILSTLLIDLNPQSPATATAANNLVRCLVGAGATALVVPMINAMGKGWCFTFIAGFLFVTSPMVMVLWKWGPKWREEKRARMEREEKEKEVREVEDLQVEMDADEEGLRGEKAAGDGKKESQ